MATELTLPGRRRAQIDVGSTLLWAGIGFGLACAGTAWWMRQRASARGEQSATRGTEPFVEQSMTVNRSPEECYEFWRNVTNHPKFARMLESVTPIDERRSHWVLKGPGGVKLEWDSEITVDRPGERIAWHSLEGSQVLHAGTVRFERAPASRGTIVRVSMHYRAPLSRASTGFAKAFGRDPNGEVREDLRRFKALIEAGEIPSTRGQPSGRRSLLGRLTPAGRKSRAARPERGGRREETRADDGRFRPGEFPQGATQEGKPS
jgi:uncharacterized membrane protein